MRAFRQLLAAPADRPFPYEGGPYEGRPYEGRPYEAGRPVALTPWRAAVILAACAAGFAALLAAPHLVPGRTGGWLGVVSFVVLPLSGLALATRAGWTAIFKRPTARDVWVGLAFVPLTFAASASVAIVLVRAGLTSANPIGHMMSTASGVDLGLYFASTGVQLMGEELVTILPFLVMLSALRAAGVGGRPAMLFAWIASALIFGALHLPTYQWHVAQSLLVIGAARLMLTAPFLITRNIWSSYIAHVTNDWSLFVLIVVLPKLGASPALI